MPTARGPWPWSKWSLARQLPLLTAAIIVLVLALSLTLTYRALIQTRSESFHARMSGVLKVIVTGSAASTRQRVTLLRSVAGDSAIARALTRATAVANPGTDSAVIAQLTKLALPTDSGLPIELWTADGRRIAHVGSDLRGDSVRTLRPELRSLGGIRTSEAPTRSQGADSVYFGPLYESSGRVLFWSVVPVLSAGARTGFIAQQRRVNASPAIGKTLRDLSGEEFKLYFRNKTDNFFSSLDGRPVATLLKRDSTVDGYVAHRAGGTVDVGMESSIAGMPYIFALESPMSSIVEGPRETLRQISMISLVLLAGGIVASWLLSRQITRPLAELATAAEAIARGESGPRVNTQHASSDEVMRLGSSFNRMASEVEASQHELATQVEEALAVSEALEQVNAQLQETSEEASEARDAALHANQAKSDFLAVMSHELRTPLNAIGGYTDILKLGIYGPLNEQQQDAMTRIARSQQTLLSLINDVLNFAKLEAGEVQYTITDVPITSALDALEEVVAPQLRDRDIHYRVHDCPKGVTVRADADKLQQILINLLSNAIKYSAKGGRIDVMCDVTDTQVRVHVHDTGIGIAPDRIDRIFDPFIQVGRALNRPHEGVGLGLSISRDLAAAMGGALSVTSVLAEGSTFTLTLVRGVESSQAA